MREFLAGVVLTVALSAAIKGGVALSGRSMAWAYATVIAAVAVASGAVFSSTWID